jgi:hypothetical protein
MVVRKPLACNNFARDAAIIPFPKLLVTPPVTKINFAIIYGLKKLSFLLIFFDQLYQMAQHRCVTPLYFSSLFSFFLRYFNNLTLYVNRAIKSKLRLKSFKLPFNEFLKIEIN